jgi:hypothetical protein
MPRLKFEASSVSLGFPSAVTKRETSLLPVMAGGGHQVRGGLFGRPIFGRFRHMTYRNCTEVLRALGPQCPCISDLFLPKAHFCGIGEAFGVNVSILALQGGTFLLEVELWKAPEKLSLRSYLYLSTAFEETIAMYLAK